MQIICKSFRLYFSYKTIRSKSYYGVRCSHSGNSKLYELWQDSDDCGEWVRNLNELKERLNNAF
ncbi:hypothetical protein PT23B2_10390 [Acinetobacter towneri]